MVPNRGSLRNPGASSSSEYRLVTVGRRIAVIESGGKELWQVAERNFVHAGCGHGPVIWNDQSAWCACWNYSDRSILLKLSNR